MATEVTVVDPLVLEIHDAKFKTACCCYICTPCNCKECLGCQQKCGVLCCDCYMKGNCCECTHSQKCFKSCTCCTCVAQCCCVIEACAIPCSETVPCMIGCCGLMCKDAPKPGGVVGGHSNQETVSRPPGQA
eukprot:TRINITY_DN591_c0_g4_i2.p2 TRINITY_DN591_c0_g4~~TRINITY_DN591_c0_g4_i2.p2  ORF type:complete len:132 (+),score=17.07 TRINITY_DN591_c0_g4_i2:128-523(+)